MISRFVLGLAQIAVDSGTALTAEYTFRSNVRSAMKRHLRRTLSIERTWHVKSKAGKLGRIFLSQGTLF